VRIGQERRTAKEKRTLSSKREIVLKDLAVMRINKEFSTEDVICM